MSSDATDNTMRAEFEAWCAREGMDRSYWLGKPEQGYNNSRVADYWYGWKAARADTARQVAELEARLAKCEEQAQNALSWRDMIDRNRSRLTDMERERIRSDEREACAAVCENLRHEYLRDTPDVYMEIIRADSYEVAADVIRARSTPPTDASQYSKPDRAPSEDGCRG